MKPATHCERGTVTCLVETLQHRVGPECVRPVAHWSLSPEFQDRRDVLVCFLNTDFIFREGKGGRRNRRETWISCLSHVTPEGMVSAPYAITLQWAGVEAITEPLRGTTSSGMYPPLEI